MNTLSPQLNIISEATQQDELIKEITSHVKKHKVLSTLPYHKIDFWMNSVDTIVPKTGFINRCNYILELLKKSKDYDAVLLAGGERVDLIYLTLAGLLGIKTPHFVIDAHWQPSKGIAHTIQKLMFFYANKAAVQFQPHSPEEIEIYNRNFGIPKNKLNPIQWSTSIIGYDFESEFGDFILTGGASFRDYETFLRAVSNTNYPVEIGLPGKYPLPLQEKVKKSPNISVHTTWSMSEFYKKMSQCRIFAVPITPGLERCAGDQSILNAMSFGKIVIATDSIATRLYIKNGINGFIVPESNPEKWRDLIDYVYSLDEKEYEKIGSQAEYSAKYVFNEKMRLYKTLHSVVDYFKKHYDHPQKVQEHISFDLIETPEKTTPIPEKH